MTGVDLRLTEGPYIGIGSQRRGLQKKKSESLVKKGARGGEGKKIAKG